MTNYRSRLLKVDDIKDCNKNVTGVLHKTFCPNGNSTCDPYYLKNNLTISRGIKGLSSGTTSTMASWSKANS
nr:unnamed protein product [Callosobruchus analis]